MNLEIKIPENKKDIIIVNLKGRLDVHLSSEIENQLNKLIDDGNKKIILNLENVEYLSSSALRIFIATSRRLKEVGGMLKFMKLNETAKKIFKIVELMDIFDIYETEDEALKSFS